MDDFADVKCIVLGASGFIGMNLCNRLIREGAVVRGFGRSLEKPKALSEKVEWRSGEITDEIAVADAIKGCEVIFHLIGGSIPESAHRSTSDNLSLLVLPTLNLLEKATRSGAKRIIFASSGGTVYGIPSVVPITEQCITSPISDYGLSKLFIEKYLEFYRYHHSLEYVVLRLSNPYGPLQSPYKAQGVVPHLLFRALKGEALEIWGTGQVVRDFIFIDDVINAFLLAMRYSGDSRVMNVGSAVGRSITQIAEDIGRVSGVPNIQIVHRPGQKSDVPFNILDNLRAQRELGWTIDTTWETGLRLTAQWMKAELQCE
jgi:UDP-glucose 4-epimerase